jgi:two-component system chemotaxis response regulator CheB
MRRELSRLLEIDPFIQVVGTARDGQDTLEKVTALNPDVVALDINMPVMDGLTCLQHIMQSSPRPVVMVSSLTHEGALTAYEAMELGAVDFIGKPSGTVSKYMDQIATDLIYKVHAAANARVRGVSPRRLKHRKLKPSPVLPRGRRQLVVIGQSTGGPGVIMDILPLLPADLNATVVIVQHMPGAFTPSFAQRLDKNCAFPFHEAKANEILQVSHGYLAPGGRHLTFLRRNLLDVVVRLSDYPEDTLHKPSVDVTMNSAVDVYSRNVIAVLLTGMGDDGADAMVRVRQKGGRTIAESEETCVVFGMPREAIVRGGAEWVLPSYAVGDKIVELVNAMSK